MLSIHQHFNLRRHLEIAGRVSLLKFEIISVQIHVLINALWVSLSEGSTNILGFLEDKILISLILQILGESLLMIFI